MHCKKTHLSLIVFFFFKEVTFKEFLVLPFLFDKKLGKMDERGFLKKKKEYRMQDLVVIYAPPLHAVSSISASSFFLFFLPAFKIFRLQKQSKLSKIIQREELIPA